MASTLVVPELRELLSAGDTHSLRQFCERGQPAVVADSLSGLEPEEIWQVLQVVELSTRADIFSHFELELQAHLVPIIDREEIAHLLEEMPHDLRVDLVQALEEELREDILPLVARAERVDIRRLSSYPEDTAGALMTTDYAALPPDTSVREALERLRLEAPDRETIYYTYVIDEQRRLIGFVSLKDLILARPARLVREVMYTDVISVRAHQDREEVADVIGHYD
ncbi:MAG: magnesium transporter, partial [Planctomycetes bacterium]|nr:magnesium transporter [Planctomycetota bacterium]